MREEFSEIGRCILRFPKKKQNSSPTKRAREIITSRSEGILHSRTKEEFLDTAVLLSQREAYRVGHLSLYRGDRSPVRPLLFRAVMACAEMQDGRFLHYQRSSDIFEVFRVSPLHMLDGRPSASSQFHAIRQWAGQWERWSMHIRCT